jgi:membrane protease YdiL (CAAX protease family)
MPTELVAGRGWLRFLFGYLVLWGVLAGISEWLDPGRWGLVILLGVAVTALAAERSIFGTPLTAVVRTLGIGRPNRRALHWAAAASIAVLAVYPIAGALTGVRFTLVADWPWILLGLFAFHGVAEEIVWRAFVFRRLSTGRSFRAAVLWTMPFVVLAHVPILFRSGPVVAVGALAVAAVTSVPLSALYLRGNRTIWAPALVHTAIDSFKLVIVPAAAVQSFPLLLVVFSLVAPLMVLVDRAGSKRSRRLSPADLEVPS